MYGQKRVEGGVGQSREPKFSVSCLHTSAHPFLAKNRPEAPVFGHCPFWYVRMSFCPGRNGNWSSLPQNEPEFSPRSIQSCVFLDPIGECNRIQPSWIEKVLTVITCNWAPGEAGKTALDRSWRKLRLMLRRGRPIFNILRAKADANVPRKYFFNGLLLIIISYV